jgi:hypothetical protein
MFTLSRYRGLALVVASVVLAMVLLDQTLRVTVGFVGRFCPDGESPTDTEVLEGTGQRISGLLAVLKRPSSDGETAFGVMLGQSTLHHGVDAEVLDENDGLPLRWVKFESYGGSLNRIRDISEMVFSSGLRPHTTLFCINPSMLVGFNFETGHRMMLRTERQFRRKWSWVYDNQLVINHLARIACHHTKLALFQSFGFNFSALYRASQSPWKPRSREGRHSESAEELARGLEQYREFGCFDPGRYSPENSNARSLVRMICAARQAGSKAAIILLPEHSLLRGSIPPEAIRCLENLNRANFPDDPVPIYDLRDRIADNLFYDLIHPGRDAVRPISILVGACVHDALSGHPSPERFRKHTDPMLPE